MKVTKTLVRTFCKSVDLVISCILGIRNTGFCCLNFIFDMKSQLLNFVFMFKMGRMVSFHGMWRKASFDS